MNVRVGGTGNVAATFNNPVQAGSQITWGSDRTDVATIPGTTQFIVGNSVNGNVFTGVGAGTATLTCTITNPDGTQATGSLSVTIDPAQAPDITSVVLTIA